ncbi:MAG: metallophosphoesterase [Deltaproteobacteria bacterium]|nr:metallophosphoesterase [Deltaproteobacteria bacterium]
MRIGVLADTHDRLPLIDRALALFRERGVEVVIHAGDLVAPFAAKRLAAWTGPLHVVYGNNDGERKGLKEVLPQIQTGPLFVELGGRRILVHHFLDWCKPADLARADVVISGHTHAVAVEEREGRLLLNPGECCAWLTGRATVALLEPERLSVEIVELHRD